VKVRAVVTAGGTVDAPLAAALGTEIKALAPFANGTLLDAVLGACAAAGLDDVAVVGGAEVRAHLRGSGARVIDAADDGGENALRALAAWPGERFVYLTSDLPFIDGVGLADFIARSGPFALTMALADERAYGERFPGAPDHGVSLAGERLVNGNAFMVAPDAVAPARAFAARLFAARKSLFALALLLGPGLCARFVIRRLAVDDIERFAQRALSVPVAALRGCDPGLCYDVDTLRDYDYACSLRV